MKLWRKLCFFFAFIGGIFGFVISIIFKDIDLLPGLSLTFSGLLLGISIGIAFDREILRGVVT